MGIIIHRSRHAQEYVIIPNSIARNTRLSFRARGLLVMLLSLPPDWHVTTDQLAEDNPEGRDLIRKAMAEVRDAGYVEVHREQDGKGRWRTRLEVFDTPQPNATRPASGVSR
jgi:DNA-binding IscR family transcriptional regulator